MAARSATRRPATLSATIQTSTVATAPMMSESTTPATSAPPGRTRSRARTSIGYSGKKATELWAWRPVPAEKSPWGTVVG